MIILTGAEVKLANGDVVTFVCPQCGSNRIVGDAGITISDEGLLGTFRCADCGRVETSGVFSDPSGSLP